MEGIASLIADAWMLCALESLQQSLLVTQRVVDVSQLQTSPEQTWFWFHASSLPWANVFMALRVM